MEVRASSQANGGLMTADLITTSEAAELRGVSVWTIARWHRHKGLRAALILKGNRLVFNRADVEAFDPTADDLDDEDGAA